MRCTGDCDVHCNVSYSQILLILWNKITKNRCHQLRVLASKYLRNALAAAGEIKHSPDLLAVFQGRGRGGNGMGVDNGGWGDPDPWKYVGGVNMFWPPPKGKNVTFFHTKRLLDNSSSLTSWSMKDLCQKWKVKLIFRGAWNSLMAWPDWPRLPYFATGLRHWEIGREGMEKEEGWERGRRWC